MTQALPLIQLDQVRRPNPNTDTRIRATLGLKSRDYSASGTAGSQVRPTMMTQLSETFRGKRADESTRIMCIKIVDNNMVTKGRYTEDADRTGCRTNMLGLCALACLLACDSSQWFVRDNK